MSRTIHKKAHTRAFESDSANETLKSNSLVVEDFEKALTSALDDPSLLFELASVASKLDSNDEALLSVLKTKLDAVVVTANEKRRGRPVRSPTSQSRFDMLQLSPGRCVLKGTLAGKAYLSTALGCMVEEGHNLALLNEPDCAKAFQEVRSGRSGAQCVSRANIDICFAPSHRDPNREPGTPPDAIVACFWSVATESLPGPVTTQRAIPISTGRFLRAYSAEYPKPPREWLLSTPARRFVRLPDGRSMAYRVYGPSLGRPILVFGAINTSTLADPNLANAAIKAGSQLIVIQRPGLGASSPVETVSHRSVAEDVAYFVRRLGLKRVAIFTSGSGASFGIATARALGPLASRLGMLCPVIGKPTGAAPGQWAQLLGRMAKKDSALMHLAQQIYAVCRHWGTKRFINMMASTCARDEWILRETGMLEYMTMQVEDVFHNGMTGAIAEFRLLLSGAGFDLSEVRQPLRVWAGAKNLSILPDELRARFAGAAHTEFDIIPEMGVLFGPDDAARMMAWLTTDDT